MFTFPFLKTTALTWAHLRFLLPVDAPWFCCFFCGFLGSCFSHVVYIIFNSAPTWSFMGHRFALSNA